MHSINAKRADFSQNMHFGVNNNFSGILIFQIFLYDLVGAIGSLEAAKIKYGLVASLI